MPKLHGQDLHPRSMAKCYGQDPWLNSMIKTTAMTDGQDQQLNAMANTHSQAQRHAAPGHPQANLRSDLP